MKGYPASPGEFRAHLCEAFGLEADEQIVVGASGGLDSTVLFRALHEVGFVVVAAHVNYGLRGDASDQDEAFVRRQAEQLGVSVRVKRVELPPGGNRQERAREARYAFFNELAVETRARVVAVAHHQDDQAETVLLNLFRGAGPHGLAGMPVTRPISRDSPIRLIRPLLGWSRAEIEALATERGWSWREDDSNASDTYRRNWLRNKVLPLIEEEFGEDVVGRIADAAGRIRVMVELVDQDASARLAIESLRGLSDAQRHTRYASALRRFAPLAPRRAEALAKLDSLLDAQSGKRVAWPGVTVWRERDALVIEPERDDPASPAWSARIGASTETPLGALHIEQADSDPPDRATANRNLELADAEALVEPLCLRRWRDGDRFNPLGLDGSKLVSDLLTEVKVPASERGNQLVLCSADHIVWVVGHRLAEEARIGRFTKRAVRLRWTPAA